MKKTLLKIAALLAVALLLFGGPGALLAAPVVGAVLGMRGTGSFSTDERPTNYRELILLLFPNASSPLTALLSKMKEEMVDDPKFNIFLKGLPSQRATVGAAGATSGTNTIPLTTAADASKFKRGHAILNERTLEVFWMLLDGDATAGTLSVVRGKGAVVGTAMVSADGLWIIGNSNQEGAAIPSAVMYDPSVVFNYCQIFRNSLEQTNTAKVTRLRTGDSMKEAKREALELHAMEMEKAFLFGQGVEDLTGSQPQRTTKGLHSVISTNVKDFADAVTIDGWENFLEDVFEKGSSEKLCLCGNRALNVFNKLARVHHTINATPTSETYGVQMQTWLTPYGTLMLKQHPLLSENPTFNDWGFIIDPKQIVYRYLRNRDTQYLENRQDPGDDATKNEYLSECGLEFRFEDSHALFKNASTFVP